MIQPLVDPGAAERAIANQKVVAEATRELFEAFVASRDLGMPYVLQGPFVATTLPAKAIQDLATQRDVGWIGLDEDEDLAIIDDTVSFRERVLGGRDEQQAEAPSNWWGVPESDWFRDEFPGGAPRGHYLHEACLPIGRFRVPPIELQESLPQQLLMLEVAADALDDAGCNRVERDFRGVCHEVCQHENVYALVELAGQHLAVALDAESKLLESLGHTRAQADAHDPQHPSPEQHREEEVGGERGDQHLDEAAPRVGMNESALRQVLLNLLLNAREAAGEEGAIAVRCAPLRGGGRVEIVVEDSGAGVPPRDLQRIFDPFFTTKAAGSGLGLAICRQLVTECRGTIEFDSAPGRGAWCRSH